MASPGFLRERISSCAIYYYVLIYIFYLVAVDYDYSSAVDYCAYEILITEDEGQLGLQLSHTMVVLGFASGGGVSPSINDAIALGQLRVGDRLVAVNGRPLAGLSLAKAAGAVRKATPPKRLSLQCGPGARPRPFTGGGTPTRVLQQKPGQEERWRDGAVGAPAGRPVSRAAQISADARHAARRRRQRSARSGGQHHGTGRLVAVGETPEGETAASPYEAAFALADFGTQMWREDQASDASDASDAYVVDGGVDGMEEAAAGHTGWPCCPLRVVLVEPRNACGRLQPPLSSALSLTGALAVSVRGGCTFVDKAMQLQEANAAAVVICNTQESVLNMPGGSLPEADSVHVPVVSLARSDCNRLVSAVASAVKRRSAPLLARLLPDPEHEPTVSAVKLPVNDDVLSSDRDWNHDHDPTWPWVSEAEALGPPRDAFPAVRVLSGSEIAPGVLYVDGASIRIYLRV